MTSPPTVDGLAVERRCSAGTARRWPPAEQRRTAAQPTRFSKSPHQPSRSAALHVDLRTCKEWVHPPSAATYRVPTRRSAQRERSIATTHSHKPLAKPFQQATRMLGHQAQIWKINDDLQPTVLDPIFETPAHSCHTRPALAPAPRAGHHCGCCAENDDIRHPARSHRPSEPVTIAAGVFRCPDSVRRATSHRLSEPVTIAASSADRDIRAPPNARTGSQSRSPWPDEAPLPEREKYRHITKSDTHR